MSTHGRNLFVLGTWNSYTAPKLLFVYLLRALYFIIDHVPLCNACQEAQS